MDFAAAEKRLLYGVIRFGGLAGEWGNATDPRRGKLRRGLSLRRLGCAFVGLQVA